MEQPWHRLDRADSSATHDLNPAEDTPPARAALLSDDWRGPSEAPRPAAPAPRAGGFGKARPLYLRAAPASHGEEVDRARGVVLAAREAVEDTFELVQSGKGVTAAHLVPIINGVVASIGRNPVALPGLVRLKQDHEYTYMHSVAVCGLMVALAKEMRFDPPLVRDLGLAGLLHDIGMATIPPELLNKTTALTEAEAAEIRDHTTRGYTLLRSEAGLSNIVLDVCKHHHERLNGTGYPDRLEGDDISTYARMAAICDVYDALTTTRAYRSKCSPGEAIEYLRSEADLYDKQILGSFVRMIGAFLPGTLVRLRSDRLAVVLDELNADPLHPAVAVFCDTQGCKLSWQRVGTDFDSIISIERPDSWQLTDWPTLRNDLLALSQ